MLFRSLATVLQKQISTDLDEEKPQGVALRFPNLDKATAPLWTKIHERRKKTKHDLIVVFAFLGSETADPMDSWTFFSWLQDHDIPSRFVISETSLFYKDLIKKKKTKDVIALEKSCLKDEHSSYFLNIYLIHLSYFEAYSLELGSIQMKLNFLIMK